MNAGCTVGLVKRVSHATIKKRRVIKTAPAAGKHVAVGTKVTIVLSRGKRP